MRKVGFLNTTFYYYRTLGDFNAECADLCARLIPYPEHHIYETGKNSSLIVLMIS
ncbi:MAG TPA: hypothetical protein PKA44_06330 [Saprospiraceae bacterium]|jgi:hypothetical protein|nr:hypothetical protein [Saprospiraceae bacterium]HMT77311.1 hypothetical protein [Saprospiraceae bacterium]